MDARAAGNWCIQPSAKTNALIRRPNTRKGAAKRHRFQDDRQSGKIFQETWNSKEPEICQRSRMKRGTRIGVTRQKKKLERFCKKGTAAFGSISELQKSPKRSLEKMETSIMK